MIVAVDTGGTKTLIMLFDSEGQVIAKTKIPTQREQHLYIESVVREIQQLLPQERPQAISIALPGVIRDNIAVVCKNLDWHHFDIISHLRQFWPDTPIFVENDANLGGVGAAHLLSPLPHRLLYLTLSTGVGGGFVVDGAIDPGLSESEFGDIRLEYNGTLTSWEHLASGRAVYEIHPHALDEYTDHSIKQEIARRVSRGLITLLPVLRPDIIAIGGGLGAKYSHIDGLVRQELTILAQEYQPEIITAPHPEEIVAYGCYYHAINQYTL